MKEDLLRVQKSLRVAKEVDLYNNIVSSISTVEIDNRINSLTSKADSLYADIMGGIDTPLSDLVDMEVQYKKTVTDLNVLFSARDSYDLSPIPQPDGDYATLLEREASLKAAIAEAGYFEDIGSMDFYPIKGIDYHVNSEFGSRYDPVGERGYSFHYGLDLRSPANTPIMAWFSGTVYDTGFSYGSGNYIWIDHGDGVRSFYCHLNRIDVTKGQQVTQGTQIALSGSTGHYCTGPHLHLGLYIDGTAVDPRLVLE